MRITLSCLAVAIAVTVAAVVATPARAMEPYLAYGLDHTPVGSANVEVQPNGSLVVSNIGSSGQDGVSIDLGEVEGFSAEVGPIDMRAIGTGAVFAFEGMLGVPTRQPLGGISFQNPAGTIEVIAGFEPPGWNSILVEVLQDDTVILSGPATGGSTVATLPGLPRLSAAIVDNGDPGFQVDSFFDVFTEITVPGVGSASGNGLRMRLQDPPTTPITYTGLELRLDGVPTTTITDEAIRLFGGVQNRALGQARLEAHGGTLTVSNIGSSGQDGVWMDLGYPISPWRVLLDPIPVMPGEEINFQIDGVVGGTVGKLADFGLSRVNPHFVTLDGLTLLGATQVRVEAFNGQTSLGSTVVAVGPQIASLTGTTAEPRLTEVRAEIVSGIGSSGEDGFAIDSFFDVFTELSVGNDIYPNVDHIRLTPEDVSQSVGGFTNLGVTANGPASITLNRVTPEPSAFLLSVLGLLGLAGWVQRRKR